MLVYKEIDMMNTFFRAEEINKIINVNKRVNLIYKEKLNLAPRYINEEIHYASFLERLSRYQIFVYEGKLYDSTGKLITTKPLDFNVGAILVMDSKGNLYLSHKARGIEHHSTLLSGASVAYAYMLEILNGDIIKEEVWSGHYLPNSLTQKQFHDRLKKDFSESYDSSLKCIFIPEIEGNGLPLKSKCPMSGTPLIDAVRLPCGHWFNHEAYIQWYQVEQDNHCPIDYAPFTNEEVVRDIDKSLLTLKNYPELYSQIFKINKEYEQKVLDLKLDDWSSRAIQCIGMNEDRGVYLFLKKDTPLYRVAEIIKSIGLIPSVSSFWIKGRTTYDLNCTLEDVFRGEKSNKLCCSY